MTDPSAEPELPRAVALAWGVAAAPQRGPKRELSIERIVDVAVVLADAGGLGAVSMAAVAGELGVTPMALYRYVNAKDDLVTLMQEAGIGVPPEDIREAEGWRPALERYVHDMSRVYLEHSWLLDIPITGTPLTPNNLAWLEAALEILQPLGLGDNDQVSIVLALIAQVRWEGLIVRGYTEAAVAAGASPDDLDRRDNEILEQLVTPEEFPRVHAALHAGAFTDAGDGSDPFTFGRDRVLDGVAALLDGHGTRTVVERDPLDEAAGRDPKAREATKARREVEKQLREARKRERQALAAARERAARAAQQ